MKQLDYQRFATKVLAAAQRYDMTQQHGAYPGSYKLGKFKRAAKKGKK